MKTNFDVPYVWGLSNHMCAKYARLAAKELSGADYNPGHAWTIGKNNKVVARLNGDLENYITDMTPKESIVIFMFM